MIKFDWWKFFEYVIGGALLILTVVGGVLILGPFIIGYGIVIFFLKIYYAIQERFFPEKYHAPEPITPEESERMFQKIEEGRKQAELKWELERLRSERARQEYVAAQKTPVEAEIEDESEGIEEEPAETEEPKEEFTFHKDFYLERKLTHGQKEALFAQGYKRLKVSPFGDSGASYYWVKTRYNESKEHAFFCYLIEKELRRYTKEVELFVNSGPDVIVRYAGNVYAFDVETGKNLIRKPEETKDKFDRYKEEYYRSYIFVTNKSLKRKYQRMGIVITRSTFRKIISRIFA